jgi:hypothetical protein
MWQNQGMENTIFLPILLMSLIQIDRFIQLPNSLGEAFALGIAFGLIMWSRSDSLLFVLLALVGIGLYLWSRSRSLSVQQVRSLSVVLGITFCFGIGYLIFNYAAAGSFLSVSGVVKIGDSSESSWHLAQTLEALRLHLAMVWDLFSGLGGLTWWGFNWRTVSFKVIVFAWVILVVAWRVIEFSQDIEGTSGYPQMGQNRVNTDCIYASHRRPGYLMRSQLRGRHGITSSGSDDSSRHPSVLFTEIVEGIREQRWKKLPFSMQDRTGQWKSAFADPLSDLRRFLVCCHSGRLTCAAKYPYRDGINEPQTWPQKNLASNWRFG